VIARPSIGFLLRVVRTYRYRAIVYLPVPDHQIVQETIGCLRYVEIVEVGKTRPTYQSVRNQGNRFTLKNPKRSWAVFAVL